MHRTKTVERINVAGGVGSPCHYGGVSKEQPLLSPSHPLSGCPGTPTHNQHNANNTQHFSNHQHSSMLYHNAAAGVQSSQFCYDRMSVTLYQSGPGDAQDIRPPPSSNPASHQMGGKSCDLFMSCDHHCAPSSSSTTTALLSTSLTITHTDYPMSYHLIISHVQTCFLSKLDGFLYQCICIAVYVLPLA